MVGKTASHVVQLCARDEEKEENKITSYTFVDVYRLRCSLLRRRQSDKVLQSVAFTRGSSGTLPSVRNRQSGSMI